MDSLFIVNWTGTLTEYILEPRVKSGLEKITDESPIEVLARAWAQWPLARSVSLCICYYIVIVIIIIIREQIKSATVARIVHRIMLLMYSYNLQVALHVRLSLKDALKSSILLVAECLD